MANRLSDIKGSDGIRRRSPSGIYPPKDGEAIKLSDENQKGTFKLSKIYSYFNPKKVLSTYKKVPDPVKNDGFIITDAKDDPNPQVESGRTAQAEKSISGFGGSTSRLVDWFGVHAVFVWAAAASVFLVICVVLLSTVFAQVSVYATPKQENLELKDILILLDTSVGRVLSQQKVVPAERFEFVRTLRNDFESTGKKFVQEKARGKVKIYNRFSSSPQNLVQNTRFLTESGFLYRLPKSINVPGAKIEEGKIIPQFIEEELIADKAGGEFNVDKEVSLTIPGFKGSAKYDGFYAIAPSGFVGGFVGEARVVSKDDIKKAQEGVTKELYNEIEKEIARKVPGDFKLIDPLREIQIVSVNSPKENSLGEKFSIDAKAVGRVIAFHEKDVSELLKSVLLKDGAVREFVDGSLRLTYIVKDADFIKGRVEVVLDGTLKTKATIPADALADLIKAKKEGTIIDILKNREELLSFRIVFFPPWLFRAPSQLSKIKFRIESP